MLSTVGISLVLSKIHKNGLVLTRWPISYILPYYAIFWRKVTKNPEL